MSYSFIKPYYVEKTLIQFILDNKFWDENIPSINIFTFGNAFKFLKDYIKRNNLSVKDNNVVYFIPNPQLNTLINSKSLNLEKTLSDGRKAIELFDLNKIIYSFFIFNDVNITTAIQNELDFIKAKFAHIR